MGAIDKYVLFPGAAGLGGSGQVPISIVPDPDNPGQYLLGSVSPSSVWEAACTAVSAVDGAAAVVTLAAAGVGLCHEIKGIHCGFLTAPAAGVVVTVQDGSGQVRYQQPLTAGGALTLDINCTVRGTANTALIVTLPAGGAGRIGYMNVLGHRIVAG
jgi:hypothetical protein